MALEDQQSIQQGAEIMASLMNQGLSQDAAEEVIVNQLAEAQAAQSPQRKRRGAVSLRRGANEGNRAAAEAFLAEDARNFQSSSSPINIDDLFDDDGEFQNVIRDDSGEIRSIRRPQDDEQTYTADERERFGVEAEPDFDPNARDEGFDQQRGYTQITPDGKKTWREGGRNYSDVRFVSKERRGPDYADPSLRQLKQAPKSEVQREREARDERKRLVINSENTKERDNIDLVAMLRNEVLAEQEARELGNRPAAAAAAVGQPRLDKIQNILNIGPVKGGQSAEDVLRVVPNVDPNTFEDAVRYTDPDSGEVRGQGRGNVIYPDSSATNADAALLDAALSRNQQWAAENVRLENTGQTTVSDNLKPVSISGEMQLLADRLNAVGYGDIVPGRISSSNDFDQAMANMVTRSEREGKQLFSYDTNAGRNVASVSPGVDEVLNALHYSTPEKQQLANALYTLQSAEAMGAKPRSADRPDIQMDAGREMSGGEAPLAKIRNEKVGRGKKRKEIRAQLAQLENPDAAMPFYGAVEGEGTPRAAFISTEGRKMTPEQRVEKYGAKNAAIANELEARTEKMQVEQMGPKAPTSDVFAGQQRAIDAQFEQIGKANLKRDEAIEIEKLKRLQSLGANKNIDMFSLGENQRVIPTARAGRRLVVPQEDQLYPAGTFADKRKQKITAAEVPASIAPDPGVATGNQSAPSVDAGRGDWMGGGNGGRVVNPWQAEEPAGALVSMRQPEQSAQKPATRFYDPKYEFDVADIYKSERGRQERSKVVDRLSRENVVKGLQQENRRRRVGGAAAGAGALAGLAALIGGEREERDQEQEAMYR